MPAMITGPLSAGVVIGVGVDVTVSVVGLVTVIVVAGAFVVWVIVV